MSVADFPRPPFEERVFRIAVASLIVAQKVGRKATKRCRSRRMRAVRAIANGDAAPLSITAEQAAADAAIAWLQRACAVCGKCPGIRVMRRDLLPGD
jgi:predicted transcriptional regulator